MQPPLAEQPIDVALNTLTENLVRAREWRRLLVLLEFRGGANLYPNGSPQRASDDIAAIRSFIAGQNFELAEQWTDAMIAYKTVLSTAAEQGPVKDAADRLKALAKDHPKNVPTPATPAPTRAPLRR